MYPIQFAVIGSGWRALFYWRIACAYPAYFQMTAMLCRTEEKAARMREEYGIPAVTSELECQAGKPDFVVVAVNKLSICQVSMHWLKKGYPVLCETPAALELSDLQRLWRMRMEEGGKLQVAEQYFCYPTFQAGIRAVQMGYLGDPYMIDLSAVHDYHSASLIRRYLGVGMEMMTVFGKKYTYPVEETDSRYGAIRDGRVSMRDRVRLTFEFSGGKTAFYDFDGIQYHSHIRSRHIRVMGQCGELDDWTIRYVDREHVPHAGQMMVERTQDGTGIRQISFQGQMLYENPFELLGEKVLLPQDETAIASMMLGMRRYIEEGVEVYPLAEALQDAYVRILMEEALGSGQAVRSEPQIWN
ncbi:MAG: Gfo/Idh/MocA family oxidoreductase [Lachnospiraceae bacterium]|nr:Gfo/Idh/MocA family oxidoreductase [Lachnospiraceae bacterium]